MVVHFVGQVPLVLHFTNVVFHIKYPMTLGLTDTGKGLDSLFGDFTCNFSSFIWLYQASDDWKYLEIKDNNTLVSLRLKRSLIYFLWSSFQLTQVWLVFVLLAKSRVPWRAGRTGKYEPGSALLSAHGSMGTVLRGGVPAGACCCPTSYGAPYTKSEFQLHLRI